MCGRVALLLLVLVSCCAIPTWRLLHLLLLLSSAQQAAQPLLERHLHPTVLVRGYARALEDAVKVRGCCWVVLGLFWGGWHTCYCLNAVYL